MENKPSHDEMIIESYLMLKSQEKRLDRHGAEHREDNDKIWAAIKEMDTILSRIVQTHAERLTKLETERSLLGRLVQVFIALISGGGAGWVSHLLTQKNTTNLP